MGAADVIPGVSGGTIAFMTGIYQELIDSIKSINLNAFKLLLKGQFKAFWKTINGTFLVSLVLGIAISIFSLAKIMQYLLENYPIPIWSFFFGLILISAYYILKDLGKLNFNNILSLLVGISFGVTICLVSPTETTNELWFIALCGMIAICAMILPGISGSFILLLLGKYSFLMNAISDFNIPILAVFGIGAIIGILSFSHLLSWLLSKFYTITLTFLSGLMIGALVKVWPWKITLNSGIDTPVLPTSYPDDPHILIAICAAVLGVLLVVVINTIAEKKKKVAA